MLNPDIRQWGIIFLRTKAPSVKRPVASGKNSTGAYPHASVVKPQNITYVSVNSALSYLSSFDPYASHYSLHKYLNPQASPTPENIGNCLPHHSPI